jgi:alkylated DNA repair protein alkB family protein 1
LIATQWSTKSYDFTPERPIPFPPILAELCTAVVRKIPWAGVFNTTDDPASSPASPPESAARSETNESTQPDFSTWTEDYGAISILPGFVCRHDADMDAPGAAPDTGIVNFYQLNDTLMAHVDRAEWVVGWSHLACTRCKESTR